MRFAEFRRAAEEAYGEIPDTYLDGIDGLTVVRRAQRHPDHPEVFTLGECITEAYPSGFDGPETMRSLVVLYWGSFREVSARDPEFDWEGEIWETLTHELRHHLESLAAEDDLEGVDYAMDQGFKRAEGQDFDPFYYQRGLPAGDGVFEVEGLRFVEFVWDGEEPPTEIAIELEGEAVTLDVPRDIGDVHYAFIDGWTPGGYYVEVVLVRRLRAWTRLRRALAGTELEVTEEVVPLEDPEEP